MENRILEVINHYAEKFYENRKINKPIQEIYNRYFSGKLNGNNNIKKAIKDFKMQKVFLQNYGKEWIEGMDQLSLEETLSYYKFLPNVPYLASGQSGYFHEQIKKNGLGDFKLKPQDMQDAKFISDCFGNKTIYSENSVPITYTVLFGLDMLEFTYGEQLFPAGILEDVFQLTPNSSPINIIKPKVGEKEQDFYLRLLEHQIDISKSFDITKKQEVLIRGKRLIENFCGHKNKIYLIKVTDVKDMKISFGDVPGLRNGNLSTEETQKILQELPTFAEMVNRDNFKLDKKGKLDFDICAKLFNDPNFSCYDGVALYGTIPYEKIEYIEIDREYEILQKKALELGYAVGEDMPLSYSKGEFYQENVMSDEKQL